MSGVGRSLPVKQTSLTLLRLTRRPKIRSLMCSHLKRENVLSCLNIQRFYDPVISLAFTPTTTALNSAGFLIPKGSPMPVLSWLRKLGPGLITGAADDDPSGIATYSQVGAQF